MDSQKRMRERLGELNKENYEIQRRRMRSDQDMLDADRERRAELGEKVPEGFSASRQLRRMGQEGVPVDTVFLRKMTIPGKRRKK